MTERLPLNKRDKELIKIWAGGTGITAEIAAAAKRQLWISPKQRAILHMDGGRKPKRADYGLGVDEFSGYTEEDYLIGAYELCIGEWGD
jgi:hypothetical protein